MEQGQAKSQGPSTGRGFVLGRVQKRGRSGYHRFGRQDRGRVSTGSVGTEGSRARVPYKGFHDSVDPCVPISRCDAHTSYTVLSRLLALLAFACARLPRYYLVFALARTDLATVLEVRRDLEPLIPALGVSLRVRHGSLSHRSRDGDRLHLVARNAIDCWHQWLCSVTISWSRRFRAAWAREQGDQARCRHIDWRGS